MFNSIADVFITIVIAVAEQLKHRYADMTIPVQNMSGWKRKQCILFKAQRLVFQKLYNQEVQIEEQSIHIFSNY